MPAPAQLFAGKNKREVALLQPRVRVAYRSPRPSIPDEDAAASVFAFGNNAFEVGVFDRVIFRLRRQPAFARHQARPLRNSPALQDAIELEPEIVVERSGGVLLNYEAEDLAVGSSVAVPGGLGAFLEITFSAVFVEAHSLITRLPRQGCLRQSRRRVCRQPSTSLRTAATTSSGSSWWTKCPLFFAMTSSPRDESRARPACDSWRIASRRRRCAGVQVGANSSSPSGRPRATATSRTASGFV